MLSSNMEVPHVAQHADYSVLERIISRKGYFTEWRCKLAAKVVRSQTFGRLPVRLPEIADLRE